MRNSNQELIGKQSLVPNIRKFLFRCNTWLVIIIAIALAVVINLLAARFSYRLDLTRNQLYSLSDQSLQTIRALQKLSKPIKIYGFYQTGVRGREQVEDLLRQYKKRGAKIDYELIDPYKRPAEVKQYQVQEMGTIVFVQDAKVMRILPQELFKNEYGGLPSFSGEQAFSRTFSKMLNTETKNIYFLQGHGEREFFQAKNYLTGEGYGVKTLDLAKEGAIPADCAQLIIAGPQRDLMTKEAGLIESYLDKGGRVMILIDYGLKKMMIPKLNSLTKRWGIDFEDSLVVELDPARHGLFDNATIIPFYQSHNITDELMKNKINAVLQANRALVKMEGYKGDAVATVILESSSKSWAETNPQKSPRQDASETKGPVPLGIVAYRNSGVKHNNVEGRLVVVGTSAFIDSGNLSQAGNWNLFYNMTQWLLGQEDRISILPKQTDLTRVNITPAQGRWIQLFTYIIFPLAILVTGGIIWFRRRAR